MQVNILEELEKCGLRFEPVGQEEVKCVCPFHEDRHPSCSINIETQKFKCHAAGCGKAGDFITFLAGHFKVERHVVIKDLQERYGTDTVKPIAMQAIELYHANIWDAKTMLHQLAKRGVGEEAIRKYRLGYKDGRIIIPVFNENKVCVNLRQYLPGASAKDKMKNLRGRGKIRLYPIEQIKYDTLVICGGEMKAVAVAERVNDLGIGAISVTAGEGNWSQEFNALLSGKKIYVCMDIDRAGDKAADALCARIQHSCREVRKIRLPLDIDKYPNGDVSDYFGQEGKSREDFIALLESANIWTVPGEAPVEPLSSEFTRVDHLSGILHPGLTGTRVSTSAVVTTLDTAPYLIPRRVACTCSKDQPGCILCPVFPVDQDKAGRVFLEVNGESAAILEMVASPKKGMRESLREGLRIPPCKSVEFTPQTYYSIEDARLSPQLEISSRSLDRMVQPALVIDSGLEPNCTYEFVGRVYPHPKTQQAMFLASNAMPCQDALSEVKLNKMDYDELTIFRPEVWTVESIQDKLDDIYTDIEANATRIFQRRELHLAIDLTYHSPLLIPFDGRKIKGWVETLIVGDSAQGKSEATGRMMELYGLGEKVECKNSSVAGLLGGCQQIAGRWFVTWGVIPTHDRRLVILEELKGASTEVIAKLTDMRSSGVAEIPKIDKRRTHARTRLIAVSNPRSDKPVASYSFGIEVIKELIGSLEDIRRFDLNILLSSEQVDVEAIHNYRPKVKRVYTEGDLCRRLILYAWTREAEQITFSDEVELLIRQAATRLCGAYTDVVPIVDKGSMRLKIARLAASLAIRTFSVDRDHPELVEVRPCHVEYIEKFLFKTYDDPIFGYREFTDAMEILTTLREPIVVKRKILETPFPRDLVDSMLRTDVITPQDLSDWCGYERVETAQLLSFFVRHHALIREGRVGYRKNTLFNDLLKEMKDDPMLTNREPPQYMKGF